MITITNGKEDYNNDEDLADIIKFEAKISIFAHSYNIVVLQLVLQLIWWICKLVCLYVCSSELAPLFSIRCIPCRGVS